VLYYKGTDEGRTSGVGFIVNKTWKDRIVKFNCISDRVASLILKINARYRIQILQAYALKQSYPDEKVEEFYEEISNLCLSNK
jgi:hypothetical protein